MLTPAGKFAIMIALIALSAYQLVSTNIMTDINTLYVSPVYNTTDSSELLTYDILFPILPWYPSLYTYIAKPVGNFCIIWLLFMSYMYSVYMEHILITISIGSLLRSITLSLTRMPLTIFDLNYSNCIQLSSQDYWTIFYGALQGSTCGDYFYSAHTFGLLATWVFAYRIYSNRILNVIMAIIFPISIATLLLSRGHYTLDVAGAMVAFYIIYYAVPGWVKRINIFWGHHCKRIE